MLDKKYLRKIQKEVLNYAKKRREVIKASGDALHSSKKAIFAMHRDNFKEAKTHLEEANTLLVGLVKKFKTEPKLLSEGSYKAGLEEYVEATIFSQFLNGEKIGEIRGIEVVPDVYIGGIADVPGELYRYAVKSATNRNFEKVKECYNAAEAIIGELLNMNLTGYSRQKFDQAKNAVHKLEKVMYEVSLRNE